MVRTDIVEVYVVRGEEVLQVRRAEEPLKGTWQPVMGHVEDGETSVACARRELSEEIGLELERDAAGMWALEQVHGYFVAEIDAVVLSPRFVVRVKEGFEVRLSAEHDGARWVRSTDAKWLWPGQRAAWGEAREIVEGKSEAGERGMTRWGA